MEAVPGPTRLREGEVSQERVQTLSSRVEELLERTRQPDTDARHMAPDAFVRELSRLLRGVCEELGLLNDAGWVWSDLSRENVLYHPGIDGAVVIDPDCGGAVGEHKERCTLWTTPPERLSHDAAPLSKYTDAYAMGSWMHSLVFSDYLTWVPLTRGAEESEQFFQLMAGLDEFKKKGSILEAMQSLHERNSAVPEGQRCPPAVAEALDEKGFFSLVDKLMRPHADPLVAGGPLRWTLTQSCRESQFLSLGAH